MVLVGGGGVFYEERIPVGVLGGGPLWGGGGGGQGDRDLNSVPFYGTSSWELPPLSCGGVSPCTGSGPLGDTTATDHGIYPPGI